jgi:hypothetical protein
MLRLTSSLTAALFAASAFLLPVVTRAATRITVERVDTGQVTVHYQFSDEVTQIDFELDSPMIRNGYWRVDEPGFVLHGDRLASAKAFDKVAVTLVPNDRPVDRVFPLLTGFL